VEGTFNLPLVKDVFALRFTGYKDDIAGYIDNIVPAQAPIDWTATGEALLSLLTGQPVDLPDGALIVPGSGAIARKDVNREDTVGGRVSATWQASDQLRVELSYSMQEVTLDSEQYATAGAGEYVQVRRLDAFREGELKEELEIGSLTVRYDWDTVSLISASGWTTVDLTQSLDATPTVERLFFASVPAAQVQTRNGDAFTQELRLQSRGDSALQWLFGAYYLDRETHLQQVFLDYSCPTCLPNVVFGEDFLFSGESFVNEKQKAVFGEVSYALSPRWTVGVGGRWLDEELRYRVPRAGGIAANGAIPPTDITDSVTEVNPSAFLRFQPSDDMTLYLQAARGFRAGSPNQTLPSVCDADVAARRIKPITEPDTAWNYEFGLKSALADNRVNVNLAVYHADWKDIQIPGNLPCGFASVSNAGDATARGVEVELLAQPWDAWKFNLSASYNDNEFDRVRPETGYINGERLPLSPKKNVSAGVEYGFPIGSTEWSGYARADYQYVGDLRLIFFRAPNPATPLVPGRDVVTQDAYGTGNVKLGFTRDDLAVELYGRNVTDKRAVVSTGDPTFGGYETLLRPREFGVELRYSFR
jgi:outer membrane receptor protein involved in Fe transport